MKRLIATLMLLAAISGTGVAYAEEGDWTALHVEIGSLYKQKQYDRAVLVAQQALQLADQPKEHDDGKVVTSLNNLATLYYVQGQYAQAEPLYQRALAIQEKNFGPDHTDVATSLSNLAALYKTEGLEQQAESLYQRALAIYEKNLGPFHPTTAQIRTNILLIDLATSYRKIGLKVTAVTLGKEGAVIPPIDGVAVYGAPLAWLSGPNVSVASPATSSGSTGILFINNFTKDASIDWLDVNGKPEHFADIKPGTSYVQETHVGHVWTVSAGGRVLGTVAASQSLGYVDIVGNIFASISHDLREDGVGLSQIAVIANFMACKPVYPRASILGGETGLVRIQFAIGDDGQMVASRVVQSSGFKNLDNATVDGLSHCAFKPAIKNGKPVASLLKVEYEWKLDPEPSSVKK